MKDDPLVISADVVYLLGSRAMSQSASKDAGVISLLCAASEASDASLNDFLKLAEYAWKLSLHQGYTNVGDI